MKTLIVSSYDGVCCFNVYDNGKLYERDDIEDDESHKFFHLYKLISLYVPDKDVHFFIERAFGKDYDQIFICNNGMIKVLKEKFE